jgi:hypothetical protein
MEKVKVEQRRGERRKGWGYSIGTVESFFLAFILGGSICTFGWGGALAVLGVYALLKFLVIFVLRKHE